MSSVPLDAADRLIKLTEVMHKVGWARRWSIGRPRRGRFQPPISC